MSSSPSPQLKFTLVFIPSCDRQEGPVGASLAVRVPSPRRLTPDLGRVFALTRESGLIRIVMGLHGLGWFRFLNGFYSYHEVVCLIIVHFKTTSLVRGENACFAFRR